MDQNAVKPETDRAVIPFMLLLGLEPTRIDFTNRVLTYYFPKEQAEEVLVKWNSPEMANFREYARVQKQVHAKYLALRESEKRRVA